MTLDPDLIETEDCFGKTKFAHREIVIQSGMKPETSWVTLWHEAFHVFLFDSGLSNHLNLEVQETFCDAFGLWMTSAMQQGYLEFPIYVDDEEE